MHPGECTWVNASKWMHPNECSRVNASEWMHPSEWILVNAPKSMQTKSMLPNECSHSLIRWKYRGMVGRGYLRWKHWLLCIWCTHLDLTANAFFQINSLSTGTIRSKSHNVPKFLSLYIFLERLSDKLWTVLFFAFNIINRPLMKHTLLNNTQIIFLECFL